MRQRKGLTREAARDKALRRAGTGTAALLDRAFADPAFLKLYVSAVRAVLIARSKNAQMTAIERVLHDVGRFVPSADTELAQDLLSKQVVYDAEIQAGRTHDEALVRVRAVADLVARAPRFQSHRYPIAIGNAAFVDQLGALHEPLGLTRAQRNEARQYVDDVLGEQPRRGRPPRLEMEPEEFAAAYRRARVELKQARISPTQVNIATHIGLSDRQLRNYLRRYGPTDA